MVGVCVLGILHVTCSQAPRLGTPAKIWGVSEDGCLEHGASSLAEIGGIWFPPAFAEEWWYRNSDVLVCQRHRDLMRRWYMNHLGLAEEP